MFRNLNFEEHPPFFKEVYYYSIYKEKAESENPSYTIISSLSVNVLFTDTALIVFSEV